MSDLYGPGIGGLFRRLRFQNRARDMYLAGRRNRYKPNDKSCEIIGLVSATFSHITTNSTPGDLTQTIFDTTSRSDSAQILLNNATGNTRTIIAAWIRGKPVVRLSGTGKYSPMDRVESNTTPASYQGIVHDKFTDYEKQAADGDITFETGNNFVVTVDQVNKLGDYYWKLNRDKKHIYVLNLIGFQSWFEPGEWYDLEIGGAGEAEYIDSVVECYDVRCSLRAGGAGQTSVSFREVEEDWKFDSNETARMVASGSFSRRPSQNYVTVAAQYYSGYADYYCDGTNDQEEINGAITYMGQAGGGTVQLTHGTFNITSSCTLSDEIKVCGEGDGTYVVLNATATAVCAFSAIGSSAVYVKNISVRDMMFDQIAQIKENAYIYYDHVDGYSIMNVTVRNPVDQNIKLYDSKNGQVINNRIGNASSITTSTGFSCYGIMILNAVTTSYSNIVQGNIINDLNASSYCNGIYLNDIISKHAWQVINNKIYNIDSTDGSQCVGLYIDGLYATVSSNQIFNIDPGGTSGKGLWIDSDSVGMGISNNYCYNCARDTGLANTNQDLFLDQGTDTQSAG